MESEALSVMGSGRVEDQGFGVPNFDDCYGNGLLKSPWVRGKFGLRHSGRPLPPIMILHLCLIPQH